MTDCPETPHPESSLLRGSEPAGRLARWAAALRAFGWIPLALLGVMLLLRLAAAVQCYRTPVLPSADDQAEVFRSLRYASGNLDPKLSAWGALSSLLLFALYGATYVFGRILGAFSSTQDFLRLYQTDPRLFYLVGHSFYAVVGTAAVAAVALGARKYAGRGACIVSLLILGLLPLSFQFSNNVKADGLAAFLGTVSLLLFLRLGTGDDRRTRSFLLTGLVFGLAVGAKFHLIVWGPAALYGIWPALRGGAARRVTWLALGFLAGFIVANPFLLLSPAEWLWGGYSFLTLVGDADPRKTGAYDRSQVLGFLSSAFGGPLPAALLCSVGAWGLWRGNRGVRTFALAGASILLFIAASFYSEPHHLLPLLPAQAVVAGWAFQTAWNSTRHSAARGAMVLGVALLLIPSAIAMGEGFMERSKQDSRVLSKRWVETNLPADSGVLTDWAYIPSLHRSQEDIDRELNGPRPLSDARKTLLVRTRALDLRPGFRLYVLSRRLRTMQGAEEESSVDLDLLVHEGYDHAVLSSWWYERFFAEPRLPQDDAVRAFYDRIRREGRPLAVFDPAKDPGMTGPRIEIYKLGR